MSGDLPKADRASWDWTSQADLDPTSERNDVWTNPHLPALDLRALQPLRVEISVLEDFAEALHHVKDFFAGESLLVAIVRVDSACRFLMYSHLDRPVAYERCRELREAFRPTSIGWTICSEPAWTALTTLLEHEAKNGAGFAPLLDARGTQR